MSGEISIKLQLVGEGDVEVAVNELIIGGLTGRNREAIEEHLAELAEIGVKSPSTIPLFFRVAADMLSMADAIQVLGEDTSGEAEFVLYGSDVGMLIGAGSDHTDRKVEAYSIPVSKQMCPKVVSPEVWRYVDVAGHFGELVIRSWAVIDGERLLYQEGAVSAMLSPEEVIPLYSHGTKTLAPGAAMFGGTLAAIGGVRPADHFEFELDDPVLGRTIRHGYDVLPLPVVT